MATLVVHHSADYDGLFCREIARKFLPDAEFIGWDFADSPINPERIVAGKYDAIYVMDLPLDKPFGLKEPPAFCVVDPEILGDRGKIVWIDHHKSAIESHDPRYPGYRIDGVAACRLAWQWFVFCEGFKKAGNHEVFPARDELPDKLDFFDRRVVEPFCVRLAGEYDVWDHRDTRAIPFQFGLDSEIDSNELMWIWLLGGNSDAYTMQIIAQGKCAMDCFKRRDAEMIRSRSFLLCTDGDESFKLNGKYLKFLALNTARCNSQTFAAKDVPETGHDALMAFWFNGKVWNVSLYHARHRTDLDLSDIAKRFGGGGHRGACGFTLNKEAFYFLCKLNQHSIV